MSNPRCSQLARRAPALAPAVRRLLPVVLALLFTPSVDAQPFGAIAGRVRDAATGRPIAGIEVRALTLGGDSHGPPAGRATTGPDGRYRIDGLRADPGLELHIAAIEHGTAGYLGQLYDGIPCWGSIFFRDFHGLLRYRCGDTSVVPTVIEVRARRTVHGVDFELDGRVGSIAGAVTAAATGELLAGVEIELWPRLGLRVATVTDASGRYRFGDLPPDDYRLVAGAIAGFASEVHPGVHCPYLGCEQVEGDRVPLRVGEHLEGVDFALDALGGIAGRITEAGTGMPLPGLAVVAYGDDFGNGNAPVYSSAVSDADGVYRLSALAPGGYAVLAGDGDGPYIDQVWNGVPCVGLGVLPCGYFRSDPVAVEVAATTPDVDFEIEIGGAIAGRMTGDGEPLEGVEVWVWDDADGVVAKPVTDGGGFYEVEGLPLGSYRLLSYGAVERSFVDEFYDGVPCSFGFGSYCSRGEETAVEVVPGGRIDGIDFTLERFGAIAGTLTVADDGTAIGSGAVEIWRGSDLVAWMPTDTAGRFVSPPLARGSYSVSSVVGGPGSSWADELYDGVLCPHGPWRSCSPDEGTPVVVRSGETTEGIDLSVEPAAGFTCTPTASGVCLDGGRFRAAVLWDGGAASPRSLTDEAAAFTFADLANPEVAVRLVDACEPFGTFWVFAAGLTDQNLRLEVIDSATGASWSRFNSAGEPFPAYLDTSGFADCTAPFGSEATEGPGLAPSTAGVESQVTPNPAGGSAGPCLPSPERLCLGGGRFAVEAEWELSGAAGTARAVPLSGLAGWFWFFRPGAPELLVKLLDGCAGDAPAYWVFAGGLTNLGVTLRVTDLAAGESREYINLPGGPFEPVLDTAAFGSCP